MSMCKYVCECFGNRAYVVKCVTRTGVRANLEEQGLYHDFVITVYNRGKQQNKF